MYEFVLNDQNIKTVFITFYHNLTFDNNFIFEDKIGNINTANNYQASLDSLVRTISMLEKRGKKVILIYDMPNINADIRECALVRPSISKKSKCDLNQIKLINDFEVYDNMIEELKKIRVAGQQLNISKLDDNVKRARPEDIVRRAKPDDDAKKVDKSKKRMGSTSRRAKPKAE